MDEKINLPFKVGDLAEAKTFELGYRGAWFRGKIIEISTRGGSIGHVSEYYDFPDEKLKWTRLYKVPPYHLGSTRERNRELMLRPPYPPIYSEGQVPVASEISEVMVIVNNEYEVGDLVDWWTTDCYWCGRILKLLGDGKAMLELRQPPFGEGRIYEVLLKDVRPSLDWSSECGWIVPTEDGMHLFSETMQVGIDGRVCAQIIKPLNQGEETELNHGTDESEDTTSNLQTRDSGNKLSEVAMDTQDLQSDVPHKECGTGSRFSLNSMQTDTLDAAIMDLEELVNKVKWMKKILECGVSFSETIRPEWEFVDQTPASSAPK